MQPVDDEPSDLRRSGTFLSSKSNFAQRYMRVRSWPTNGAWWMAGLERIQQRELRRSFCLRLSSISKICILVMLVAAGIRAVHVIASGNFDEVIPGVLYRSAQPDAAEIKYIVENFGVRSILNLRDEANGDWYREESAAAQRANVQLIDFPVSSGHPL